MINWFSKKRRERERKEAEEKALRESLSAKLSRYEQAHHNQNSGAADDDHTEFVIDGKKLVVFKNQITLTDIDH